MKNNFRINSLLKILTVMIVGYFIFELLFGIVTGNFGMYGNGANSSGHHASSSSASAIYSYDAIINALLLLLVKLLIVIFLLVLLSGAAKLMKEILISKENKNTYLKSKDTRVLLVLTSSLIGITVLYSISKGVYLGSNEHMQHGFNGNMYSHNNYMISIEGFLDILFNVLLYLTAIILGIEVFKYFMNKQKS